MAPDLRHPSKVVGWELQVRHVGGEEDLLIDTYSLLYDSRVIKKDIFFICIFLIWLFGMTQAGMDFHA